MATSDSLPKIGIIGGGHLGRIHAKLLSSNGNCQVVAVAEPTPTSAALIESSLGLETVKDFRSLAGAVDGVVIAAPTFLHHEIGTWCLERGIHVFMEKPIAASSEQAEELTQVAERQNAILQVGHVERFNPAWQSLKNSTCRDSVRYIEAVREGTYTGRSTDIGIVMDLMIHDIDLVLSLVQDPVESVQAFGWSVLSQHEDFAIAQLRFKNGTLAQLRASRVSESATRTMNVYCDERIERIDFASGNVTSYEPLPEVASGKRQADTLSAEERSRVKDTLFESWLNKTVRTPASTNAIVDEHTEFLNAIRFGTQVTCTGKEGTAALNVAQQILSAIHKSKPEGSILPGRFAA